MGTEISRNPDAEILREPNWSATKRDGDVHETVQVSLTFTCERDVHGDLVPRSGAFSIENHELPSDIEYLGESVLALLEVRETLEDWPDELPPASPQVA